jgi:hypothetical protein
MQGSKTGKGKTWGFLIKNGQCAIWGMDHG